MEKLLKTPNFDLFVAMVLKKNMKKAMALFLDELIPIVQLVLALLQMICLLPLRQMMTCIIGINKTCLRPRCKSTDVVPKSLLQVARGEHFGIFPLHPLESIYFGRLYALPPSGIPWLPPWRGVALVLDFLTGCPARDPNHGPDRKKLPEA